MMILNRIKAMLVKKQHTSQWPAEQFGKSKNSAPRWGSNYSNGVQHSFGSLIQERYDVTTDKKSGIKNDTKLWSREQQKPRDILDLLLSIIHVSLKAQKIVAMLPKLNF